MPTNPVDDDEGERLLAKLTPGEWSFGDGAIHSKSASGGAWIPSYTNELGELSERAMADGLAIEWLIRNRNAMIARIRDLENQVAQLTQARDAGKGGDDATSR